MGSKLRNTVRTKNNVVGATTTFQKVGKGTASTKARHGKVPVMNVDHTPIECTLQDYYAGDWVDQLDELKTNINEQQVVAKAGAYALGRKTDELIISQLGTSNQFAGSNLDGLTTAKVLTAFEMLGEVDVPDDGRRFAPPTCRAWAT
jgi:Phage capsid protein